jgi:hypothetical protein
MMLLLVSCAADAQLFRAYLASDGSDANPCTLTAPCRLLPAALAAVASGGEIWMLDSANYNTATVTLDKSVTILAIPGVVGSIVSVGTAGIRVPAGPSLKVVLRNLSFVRLPGSGFAGVDVLGSTVSIEGCVVAGMPGFGISITAGTVRLSDSIVRNNTSYGLDVGDNARPMSFARSSSTTPAAASPSAAPPPGLPRPASAIRPFRAMPAAACRSTATRADAPPSPT